jgi:hypothetical protein
LIFSAIEHRSIGGQVNNYLFSKALGIFALSSTILVIHYTYTGITGRSIVLVDVASYAAGALVCQVLAFRLYKRKPLSGSLKAGGALFLILMGSLLALFTYFPPHKGIFMDKTNNTYGIKMEK